MLQLTGNPVLEHFVQDGFIHFDIARGTALSHSYDIVCHTQRIATSIQMISYPPRQYFVHVSHISLPQM